MAGLEEPRRHLGLEVEADAYLISPKCGFSQERGAEAMLLELGPSSEPAKKFPAQ